MQSTIPVNRVALYQCSCTKRRLSRDLGLFVFSRTTYLALDFCGSIASKPLAEIGTKNREISLFDCGHRI
jgi:hypothetical protein